MSDAYELGTAETFDKYSTPYNVLKTGKQTVQFSHDPSKSLTKRRYGYYSNNAFFDATNIASNEPSGTITISTTATGTDTARIRSAIAGQYVSQTLAKPGVGLDVDSANINYDADGYVSTSHGQIAVGAGWHDGSSGGWGAAENGGPIQTFLGRVYTPTGAEAVCISDGNHVHGSPVPQPQWNLDDLSGQDDADNPSGVQLRPDDGVINNFPYTWYAFGALFDGIVPPEEDEEVLSHKFVPDSSSLDRSNLTPMVILDNDGTATAMSAELGGMQFSVYGADIKGGEGGEDRGTEMTRLTGTNANGFISDTVVVNNESIDVNAEPGKPALAVKRETGVRDVAFRIEELGVEPDTNVYIIAWDEYDPATALDGTFRQPNKPRNTEESLLEVNTTCTTYTPTQAVQRGWDKVKGANDADIAPVSTTDEIPIDATRVYTLVNDGSAGDAEILVRGIEGY